MRELKVGDVLYKPKHKSGRECFFTITKIGRKWIYLGNNNNRCSIDELILDTMGNVLIKLYISKGEYERSLRKTLLDWLDLRKHFQDNYKRPESMTSEKIEAIRKILGVDIK